MNDQIDVYAGISKNNTMKFNRETANEHLLLRSELIKPRKGIKSKMEAKIKLEDLKKHLELDFASKYKAFQTIDQGVRNSEPKLKQLTINKGKVKPPSFANPNIENESIHQIINNYNSLYKNMSESNHLSVVNEGKKSACKPKTVITITKQASVDKIKGNEENSHNQKVNPHRKQKNSLNVKFANIMGLNAFMKSEKSTILRF